MGISFHFKETGVHCLCLEYFLRKFRLAFHNLCRQTPRASTPNPVQNPSVFYHLDNQIETVNSDVIIKENYVIQNVIINGIVMATK